MKKFLQSGWGRFLLFLLFITSIILIYQLVYKPYKQRQREEAAAKTFDPVYERMQESRKSKSPYDLEETIRIINGLDIAMQQKDNFNDFMIYMARQDYSHVAPEVVDARTKVLKTLQQLYAKQTDLEEKQALWNVTRQMSGVVLGEIGTEDLITHGATLPFKSVETIKKSYLKMEEIEKDRKILKHDIDDIESQLFDVMIGYSHVYYKYVNEWDAVCVNRDMAYLAAYSGNYAAMDAALNKLFAQYPDDKEGMLLKAYTMIQQMPTVPITDAPETPQMQVLPYLDNYILKHPGETAPALLLKGAYYQKRGDWNNAKLNFEEAAVYYPKQSDQLTDMLNPYKMRSYLHKSKEGMHIVELYKSSMLGAGYYSPDLQLAKSYYDLGDEKAGKEKILDHFARRRNQSAWDYIFSDINFCEKVIGVSFMKIFPQDAYLDLKADVKHNLSENSDYIQAGIDNRSDVKLHNVSMILCIQFTGMTRDDYVSIKMEKTLPELQPHAYNDFGRVDKQGAGFWESTWNSTKYLLSLGNTLFNSGTQKPEEIVKTRAVIISDEAVAWVDAPDTKITRTQELDASQKISPDKLDLPMSKLQDMIKSHFSISLEKNLIGKDEIKVRLPASLAIFQPMFQLYDVQKGKLIDPSDNIIKNGNIELSFKTNTDETQQLQLRMKSLSVEGTLDLKGSRDHGFQLTSVSLH